MQPNNTLTTLFNHNLWANLKLLECCAELTSEQLAGTIVGVYGSIYDTLHHIARSEQSYFYRIRTGQPLRRSENEPPLTIADMIESLRISGSGLIELAGNIQGEDTVQIRWHDDALRDVPKAIIFNQAINHATEHRAQIMAILTQLGIEPPDLDSWTYFDELS